MGPQILPRTAVTIALIFLIFCGQLRVQAQEWKTPGLLGIGIESYRETNNPFSFAKEDQSQFQFPSGIFGNIIYLRNFTKKISVTVTSGFGSFKATTILTNKIPTTYSSVMIPLKLEGHFSLVHNNWIGLALIGGMGLHWVDLDTKDNALNTTRTSKDLYFTYQYGLSLRSAGPHLTVNMVVNNFNNRQFVALGFHIYVYSFKARSK